MSVVRTILIVFAIGCGGRAIASGDAGGSFTDTDVPGDTGAGTVIDTGTSCPPPNLSPGNCVMCDGHIYCGH
jgi:hypothetical protein